MKKQKFSTFFIVVKRKYVLIFGEHLFFCYYTSKSLISKLLHVSSNFTNNHIILSYCTCRCFCSSKASRYYWRKRSMIPHKNLEWNRLCIFKSNEYHYFYYHHVDADKNPSFELWSYDGRKACIYEGNASSCWFKTW